MIEILEMNEDTQTVVYREHMVTQQIILTRLVFSLVQSAFRSGQAGVRNAIKGALGLDVRS